MLLVFGILSHTDAQFSPFVPMLQFTPRGKGTKYFRPKFLFAISVFFNYSFILYHLSEHWLLSIAAILMVRVTFNITWTLKLIPETIKRMEHKL